MAAPRAISSGTISFGLVSIPVRVYVATSPQTVRFNQLHAECGGRVKQQLYCPSCDTTVSRDDLVKGYEYAKGQYVRLTDEELKQLEADKTYNLDIVEFVPLDSVDLVYVDKSYYLGPDKGGAKAYRLLSDAMKDTGMVAVGRYWTRGKQQLVLLRPYHEGLLLHYVYYADEVRSFEDIELGDKTEYAKKELEMAEQLIEQLSAERFDATQYTDEWRDRVMQAIEEKVAGEEITTAPQAPQAEVIDLFDALQQSLGGSSGAKQAASRKKTGRGKKRSSSQGGGNGQDGEAEGGGGKGGRGNERASGDAGSIKPPKKAQPKKRGGSKKKKSGSG